MKNTPSAKASSVSVVHNPFNTAKMKTFEQFVLDWWRNYLSEADDDTLKALMENLIGEDETIEDYIPEDAECPYDWLYANMTDADEIYSKYFSYDHDSVCPDNMPDTAEFVYQMLKENADWYVHRNQWQAGTLPSFAEDFLRDMANHIEGYDNPIGFFKDLQNGCRSGMIGMLIYNSDCKRIYIEHIDDMEEYAEQIYDEVGYVENRERDPHYVHICWLCYEEFGYQIGRALFPDTF